MRPLTAVAFVFPWQRVRGRGGQHFDVFLCSHVDQDGTIESFSATAEQLFGYTADEIIGRNVSILMPSPDRERHDSYIARYLRTGERRIIGVGRTLACWAVGLSALVWPVGLGRSDSRYILLHNVTTRAPRGIMA